MIAALARSAVIMERPQFLKAAQRAERFLWEYIHMGNGLIMARWRQGEAKYPGILDDYAFFIWGLLECYGAVSYTHLGSAGYTKKNWIGVSVSGIPVV